MDALSVTMALRESEKFRRSKAQGVLSQAVRSKGASSLPTGESPAGIVATSKPIPIIAFAEVENTKADDLRTYMASGMDGCIVKPIEKEALLSTMKAAVPHHLRRKATGSRKQEQIAQVSMVRGLGFLEKSAAKAAIGMPVARGESKEDFIHGIMRVDSDTEITYCVIGSRLRTPPKSRIDCSPAYNLVICHDMFDHYEKLKILLVPIIKRCPGAQALLWNYPGQAYTKWRENQVINNEYLASILSKLLDHTKSLGQFDETSKGEGPTTTNSPFHLVGYGIGVAVACFYSSHYPCPNLRSIVSINGFSYVDPHHAGVLRDCKAVFKECPETRLDLPYYFYARFLFSPQYLHRVTPSLALNIYTAVHNPISLAGRVALCDGTLCTVDLRPVMAEIDVPIICLHSTEGRLICKNHLEPFTTRGVKDGGCEVQSIHMALLGWKRKRKEGPSPSKLPLTAKTCVIWVKSGHEVFQEARTKVLTILEEMISGRHEHNEVVYKNETPTSPSSKNNPLGISDDRVQEESFIENVLHLSRRKRKEELLPAQDVAESHNQHDEILLSSSSSSKRGDGASGAGDSKDVTTQPPISVGAELNCSNREAPIGKTFSEAQKFLIRKQQEISINHVEEQQQCHSRRCRSPKKNHGMSEEEISVKKSYLGTSRSSSSRQILSPSPTRQGRKSNNNNNLAHHLPEKCIPEFREYMNWRLDRNKKKLSWMEGAAVKIQSLARGHQARKRVKRKREHLAALCIQQTFRGHRARFKVLIGLRCIRAAQIIQRYWRAYLGRQMFILNERQHNAATAISCAWRGMMSRQRTSVLVKRRDVAIAVIQALYRGWKGRKEAFHRKREKMAAISLQRIYRGYIGRNKASRERAKYMFSVAQSAGVEFGCQILLEHKLHATRLQSEVAVLSNEKIETEKVVDELLEEISRLEEGVATLESEMHQLGRVEVEAGVILDQDALFDLREQKIRLDSEFGIMLGKITDRKERLSCLETKLARFNQERFTKEQELRSLGRKLVVLLEEQQRELEYIRSRQETRASSSGTGVNTNHEGHNESSVLQPQRKTDGRNATCCGPSTQDKQQAAQLMQSTETLMKFGFMSMSMTYFSSLNMIRAMRKVGATDTVMGALVKVQQEGDAAVNSSGSGGIEERPGQQRAINMSHAGPESLTTALKPGQVPGSQPLRVSAWSVDDVGRWLQCLSLSQYQSAFAEAAVDGALLYDLNEDDLKNTLGIDHRLHSKKIVKAIERLKNAEMEHQKQTALNIAQGYTKKPEVKPQSVGLGEHNTAQFGSAVDAMGIVATENGDGLFSQYIQGNNRIDGSFGGDISLSFLKLAPMVRHKKLKALRHALERVPDKRFVSSLIQQQYVPDVGTVYISQYDAQVFHMNQAEKHGNTLFLLAAQNGSVKIAKLLLSKGANPNHQNAQGQTAGHYATTYHFFDFAEWLYDTNGAGANDSLQNFHKLGLYDGLSPDVSYEDHQRISGENVS